MRRLDRFDWLWRPEYRVRYVGEGNPAAFSAYGKVHETLYLDKRTAQKAVAKYVVTGTAGAMMNDFRVERYHFQIELLPAVAVVGISAASLIHSYL